MDNEPQTTQDETKPSGLPLFFKSPAVLDITQHADAAIITDANYEFAKHTNSIPLNASEFLLAAKYYPIVLTGDESPMAIAIVGLEQENYFISERNEWKEGAYVPAYVRKYPFLFTELADAKQLALCVDTGAKHFTPKSGKQSVRLFENGRASALTKNALEFCTAFHNHFQVTKRFVTALREEGLLVENSSEAKLFNGRVICLNGFNVIDQEKFQALSDEKLLQFNKEGWLALIYFMFQSASNWNSLVNLAAAREKPSKGSKKATLN